MQKNCNKYVWWMVDVRGWWTIWKTIRMDCMWYLNKQHTPYNGLINDLIFFRLVRIGCKLPAAWKKLKIQCFNQIAINWTRKMNFAFFFTFFSYSLTTNAGLLLWRKFKLASAMLHFSSSVSLADNIFLSFSIRENHFM